MTSPNQPFFNRLYVRIWLAVVFAVLVLVFLVGLAWRESAERKLADASIAPVVREVIVRSSTGEEIGNATAAPHVPGTAWEFSIPVKTPLAVGETLTIEIPRPRRLNPKTGELETISPQELRERFGRPDRPLRQNRKDKRNPPDHAFDPSDPSNRSWFTPPFGFVWMLGLVGLAVALGTYPVIRRLTKRLESLQRGVEQWGQGDLSTRVAVQGNDEVGFLAERFNTAAARIEALVGSHKSLLANASHELRSPLTRIRMSVALMDSAHSTPAQERLKDEISNNITELDQLIGEILLASRLDSVQADVGTFESVDLIGMAAEECAHTGAELDVQAGVAALNVPGVPKLLRRLMRNLLENANRYAKTGDNHAVTPTNQAVVLSLSTEAKHALIRVSDRGPGVPAELRERIFEPFFRAPGASEREGGVGLGLALVKSIAQRHGGSVRCEAGLDGRGASFVVTLPV